MALFNDIFDLLSDDIFNNVDSFYSIAPLKNVIDFNEQSKTPELYTEKADLFNSKEYSGLTTPRNCCLYSQNNNLVTNIEALKADALRKRQVRVRNQPRASKIPPEVMSSLINRSKDGKFYCLYQNCGRAFSRKYNISMHIQTHLYDRPYRCVVCQAGFVRGHDLSRHVLIHGGKAAKIYHCPCGKNFSRCDALNRHRKRGICIGAFAE